MTTPGQTKRFPRPLGRGRMPAWAILLAISLVATCVGGLALVKVFRDESHYRTSSYNSCIASRTGIHAITDAFTKLRSADRGILDAAKKHEPVTGFGKIDLTGIQMRVAAYSEILILTTVGEHFDCATLK